MDHLSCHFWSTLACFHPKGKLIGRHQTLYKNTKTQKKGKNNLQDKAYGYTTTKMGCNLLA